jgi:hypothetical protein
LRTGIALAPQAWAPAGSAQDEAGISRAGSFVLEHVDAVGVHHRREPVRDQDRDQVAVRRDVPVVRLISSSVSESSEEVASSKTSSCVRPIGS